MASPFVAFRFANMHGQKKLNLVAPEISSEISYAIKKDRFVVNNNRKKEIIEISRLFLFFVPTN